MKSLRFLITAENSSISVDKPFITTLLAFQIKNTPYLVFTICLY
jgi:hypothetical protein